jgi:hypothetical protein
VTIVVREVAGAEAAEYGLVAEVDGVEVGTVTLASRHTGVHVADLAVADADRAVVEALLDAASLRAVAGGRPRLTACVKKDDPTSALLLGYGLRELDPMYISAAMLLPREAGESGEERRRSPWRALDARLRFPGSGVLTADVRDVQAFYGQPFDGISCGVGYARIVADFEVGDDPDAGFRFEDRTGVTDEEIAAALRAAGQSAVEALEAAYDGRPGDVVVAIHDYRWHEVDSHAIAFGRVGHRAVSQAFAMQEFRRLTSAA